MDSTTILIIAIAASLIAVTGVAIYTSFGPPSVKLADPYDDHED